MHDAESTVERLISLFSYLSALAMIVITALVSLGALSRYTGTIGSWWMELSTILVVWLIYLNVGTSIIEDEHIRVTYFQERLSESHQRTLEDATLVLNIVTLLVLLIAAVLALREARGTTTPVLKWSRTVLYGAFAVGIATLIMGYGSKLYARIAGAQSNES